MTLRTLSITAARIVCVHSDYLDAIDGIRSQLPSVTHFVALEGAMGDWLDYEAILSAAETTYVRPAIAESDLISINYTSGTTALTERGEMITHCNAYLNVLGTSIHHSLAPKDRYLWTLPMFHANGWTFVWTVMVCGATYILS